MAGVFFLSLSKALVLRSSSPRDAIREKKDEGKEEGERKRKNKKTQTRSRVMSMNFYIEILSRRCREGKIKTKFRFATIMTYVRAYHRRFRRFFFFLSSS